ncbi:hypothetical protein [Geomonas sp.]|uniref:hypothetical protein n=1 Tax=Geomonas sp. TaxID=2651584 RepID=UPI002B49A2E5|nr:hypothetical protein [Geomonas sp.]HJV37107.1 hypothetical protein [Geomonas sp.]
MTRGSLIIAAALLLAACSSSHSVRPDSQAGIPVDHQQTLGQDKAKDDACECCQKCKAAKSSIKSKETEGQQMKDGCKDCCGNCGEVLKPAPEAAPPEKIEKKIRLPEQ